MINKKQSRISIKPRPNQNSCDSFCFQDCSDKYDELIVVRNTSLLVTNEDQTKVSLKKSWDQKITKLSLNNHSQSEKQLHGLDKIRSSTNRSRQSVSGNVYDIELFKKKNKIETEIKEIRKQLQKLSEEYQNRLGSLLQIKEEIKDRKIYKQNEGSKEKTRHKITSVIEVRDQKR